MDQPDLTQAILDWTAVFMRRSSHDFLRFARRSGLSMAQMNVLLRIYYHGPTEIRGLLHFLEVSKAAAGQLVERMEQQELVERTPDPRDRRMRQVRLTERGRELVEASIQARQAWLSALIQSFPPQEQAEIAKMLARLADEAARLETMPATPETNRRDPSVED